MRANLLIAAIAGLSLVSACKDNPKFDDDFGGTGLLRGRLVYIDRFAGNGTSTPLAKRTVYLALNPSDQLNFKYSVTTDKDGYFLFDHLKLSQKYDVFFNDTIRQVRYTAINSTTPTDTPFLLTAKNDTLNQNGCSLTVLDRRGTPLAAAQVCMFNSAVLARIDTCLGSIRQFPTDANGRAVTYNLVARRYYFRLYGRYGGIKLKAYDSLDVSPAGIATKKITLH